MNKPKLIQVRKKTFLEKQPPGPPEWEVIETNEVLAADEKQGVLIGIKKPGKTLAQKIKSFFRF